MRFVIHPDALNGDDDDILALIDRLVDRIADEVHRIDIPAADLLQESDWYRSARPTRQKLLTSAVAVPPRRAEDKRGPHLKIIEVSDAGSARLAVKLAHTPLVVLVEDREADGVFLDILVEELGWSALRALWERNQEVVPPAAEIVSAGGRDAIPQRVERAANDAVQGNRSLRLFVVCDCDSRWPDDDHVERTRPVNAVRKACDEHKVPLHVWQKRCAENYIPDKVFEAVRDDPRNLNRVDRFDALLRRSPVQRDHFPVKARLTASERAEAIKAGLYDPEEEADLILLEERLFAKRPRPLNRLHKERRAAFTADGLRKRDGAGELDQLLHALAKEL